MIRDLLYKTRQAFAKTLEIRKKFTKHKKGKGCNSTALLRLLLFGSLTNRFPK